MGDNVRIGSLVSRQNLRKKSRHERTSKETGARVQGRAGAARGEFGGEGAADFVRATLYIYALGQEGDGLGHVTGGHVTGGQVTGGQVTNAEISEPQSELAASNAPLAPKRFFVPFSLPGETIDAQISGNQARIVNLIERSVERFDPSCRHFGRCGGCRLQHWATEPLADWKREAVRMALAREGLDAAIEPTLAAWGEGRRRTALHGRLAGSEVRLGYAERATHRTVAIEECPVLHADIVAKLPVLRQIAAVFLRHRPAIAIHATLAANGLDLDIRGAAKQQGFNLSADDRVGLGELAQNSGLARIAMAGEPVVQCVQPIIHFGAANVPLPSGAFLQATQAGEAALAHHVLDIVQRAKAAGAKRAVDLFAGCGSFALRMVDYVETDAYETDPLMVSAMMRGFSSIPGRHQLRAIRRDLFRAPLAPQDLRKIDIMVLDPPRLGAAAQIGLVGASGISHIVYVACDATSFARDARKLVDQGFALTRIHPIDQFRWSHHVELVAEFHR